jgi:hypothetical protein
MNRPNTILAQCQSCGGTGLYRGFAEKPGEPVVCLECSGTGAKKLNYIPFAGRVHMDGVKCVRASRGSFVAGGIGGRSGTEMTYQEFLQKYTPPTG